MSNPSESRLAYLPLPDFADHIADSERYSGGGSVSAASAAFAASLTELVVTLNKKRRKNRVHLDQIDRDLRRIHDLRGLFFTAVDEDARLLNQLMSLYGNRNKKSETEYLIALQSAAQEPLDLATKIFHLLQVIQRQIAYASKFTVADLAAAATIATSCAHAALLMTDVNLNLLGDSADFERQAIDQMNFQRKHVASDLTSLNEEIQSSARSSMDLQPTAESIETSS